MNRRDLLKLAAALPATPLMFADDPVQNSSQGSKTPRKVKKRPETASEPLKAYGVAVKIRGPRGLSVYRIRPGGRIGMSWSPNGLRIACTFGNNTRYGLVAYPCEIVETVVTNGTLYLPSGASIAAKEITWT